MLHSLRVITCDAVDDAVEDKKPLVIVNLQKTPYDKDCAVRIWGRTDDVMVQLMAELGLEIPQWQPTRYLQMEESQDKGVCRTCMGLHAGGSLGRSKKGLLDERRMHIKLILRRRTTKLVLDRTSISALAFPDHKSQHCRFTKMCHPLVWGCTINLRTCRGVKLWPKSATLPRMRKTNHGT